MKIRSINTRQFAGIKNKEVKFEDGLNLVIGDNECGKSTIAALIYQTLYKNTRLGSGAEDKDFKARFMPSGMAGDVIDGRLCFAGPNGEYSLFKKWKNGVSDAELTDPHGNIISNEDTINRIIDEEFAYKKGLYDDIVFSSQKNRNDVVDHVLTGLDKNSKEKQDLVSIIAAEGMTSSEGIAPEDLERIIQDKIDRLGRSWDFDIDGPKGRRGIDNPWKKERGEILEAFYQLETFKARLAKTEEIEKAIDNDSIHIQTAREKLALYNAEREEYDKYAEVIASYNSCMKLKSQLLEGKARTSADLKNYPEYLKQYGEAVRLNNLVRAKAVIDKFEKISLAKEKVEKAQAVVKGRFIDEADLEEALHLCSDIERLKSRLSNLNLAANIKKTGSQDVIIKYLSSGKTIHAGDEEIDISESIEMCIPGVMTMTIAPRGTDVDAIKTELEEKILKRDAVLAKYKADDIAELKAAFSSYEVADNALRLAENEYKNLTDNVDENKLAEEYEHFKGRKAEIGDLDNEIKKVCGEMSPESYAARLAQKTESLEEEYGRESVTDSMKLRLAELEKEIEKLNEIEKNAGNIPDKYRVIKDTDGYKQEINERIDSAAKQVEIWRQNLSEDQLRLGNESTDELKAGIEDAEGEYLKLKEDCARWKHILSVLKFTRDQVKGQSQIRDLSDRFAAYLDIISGGRVRLTSMDENMDVDIKSGESSLTYKILSEGTKDTIALAFRLAMLEHLFPDGGGLIILDDPFTDMDDKRTKQACSLLQKYADDSNQVIMFTCDSKYTELLKGNVIDMQL